ncbi:MAG: hypothetical protein HY286_05755 [Planctomycetes bacterium]|nr:hypothetical protein [Planctomycetota bacterium]
MPSGDDTPPPRETLGSLIGATGTKLNPARAFCYFAAVCVGFGALGWAYFFFGDISLGQDEWINFALTAAVTSTSAIVAYRKTNHPFASPALIAIAATVILAPARIFIFGRQHDFDYNREAFFRRESYYTIWNIVSTYIEFAIFDLFIRSRMRLPFAILFGAIISKPLAYAAGTFLSRSITGSWNTFNYSRATEDVRMLLVSSLIFAVAFLGLLSMRDSKRRSL